MTPDMASHETDSRGTARVNCSAVPLLEKPAMVPAQEAVCCGVASAVSSALASDDTKIVSTGPCSMFSFGL